MNRKMTAKERVEFEDKLRKIEGELEGLGREICSVPNSGNSWSAITSAVEYIREAIHCSYRMQDYGDGNE